MPIMERKKFPQRTEYSAVPEVISQFTVEPESVNLNTGSLAGMKSGGSYSEPSRMKTLKNFFPNFPKRWAVTILAFIGEFFSVSILANLNIAIVEMTANRTIDIGNETKIINGEFDWSSNEKAFILGAFNIGFFFAFLLGPVCHKLGGARTFGGGLALASVVTLSSPILLRVHYFAFIAGRILQGLFEACVMIGLIDTFAHWSLPTERVRLTTLASVGRIFCSVINNPLMGYIANKYGWQATFYMSGTSSLIWCFIWLTFVSDDPADDKFISKKERAFLKDMIEHISNEKAPIPWRRILSSKCVYALLNEYFTIAWLSAFVGQCVPLYISDVLGLNVQDVGWLSTIPLVGPLIVLPVIAYILDYMRSNVLSPAKVHRIFLFWGQVCTIVLTLIAGIMGSVTSSLICFSLIEISLCFAHSSYQVIPIDVAGQFAGVIQAMGASCYSVGRLASILTMGFIVKNHSRTEWNSFIFVLSFVTLYGVIVFLIFGSGEHQPWADSPKKDSAEEHSDNHVNT